MTSELNHGGREDAGTPHCQPWAAKSPSNWQRGYASRLHPTGPSATALVMSSARVGLEIFGEIPIRSRRAVVVGRQFDKVDATLVNLLTLDLILTVLGQKVALPLGAAQLQAVAVTNFAFIGLLLIWRRMTLSAVRCFLYLLTFGSAFLLQAFGPEFSLGSLLLTCVTALPFLAVAPASRETYFACLRRFQLVALFVVAMVFLDHVTQLAGLGMPDLEKLMPERMIYVHYVYIQPLHWHSSWNKPNAVFFLEASFASQFLAIALVLELALFQRFRFVMLYASGLMAVFAGTGIVLVPRSRPCHRAQVPSSRGSCFYCSSAWRSWPAWRLPPVGWI